MQDSCNYLEKMTKINLKLDALEDHLKEQIYFLKSSCDSFDKGFKGEAKRIAVVLRILFHDTRNSHSLLGQLDKKKNDFLSTAIPEMPENEATHYGLVFIGMKGKETRFIPMLDDVPFHNWMSFNDWWNEIIFIDKNKKKFSRKDIILTVSNQDGGAHVDPKLDENYINLSKNNSLDIGVFSGNNFIKLTKPEQAALRQIGHEVLKTFLLDYSNKTTEKVDMFIGGHTVSKGKKAPIIKERKIGRNQLCPCGSGKKYKHCHIRR